MYDLLLKCLVYGSLCMSCVTINFNEHLFICAGVNHEELVSLAKTHFSNVSFEYQDDAVPVLSPCRFTGSEVRRVLKII